MTQTRREQLAAAILRMLNLYGDAERRFARHPLTSPEGRAAGRAARRRARVIERLTRALAVAPLTRPGHPAWCAPGMCTVGQRPGGIHESDRQQIREGLFASLWQSNVGRPAIELQQWDQLEPDATDPTDVIPLDLTDAARLSDVLTRLADLGWGDQS